MPTIPSFRQPKIRLLIGRPDGTTWVDVSEYVSRISWQTGDVQMIGTGNTGVDGVARSLEFVLRNGEHSFSPKDSTSPWNQFDGEYEPLLDANREVVLHVSDDGGNTWRTEFHGYLGERIIIRATEVECFATDLSKPLRQKFITEARQYGSAEGTPVEDVIQQILDDYMGPGVYQLYCPVPTESVIVNQPEPWTVEYMSVWDAIQKAATEIGWWLGFRWDHESQLYRLTLLEPPTDKTTADFELDWEDDFYYEEEEITDQYVRNNITVYYRDEAGNRHSVNVRDEESIAKFGEISMIIEEQNADFIRTEEAALRLANSALHSLAWMTGHIRLDMPYLPGLDVFSTIRIRGRNPKISSDQDFYAVHSVRVVFDFQAGRFRCECLASGRVITGHARWRRMETRPGSPGMPQDPKPPTLGQPGTPTGLTGDFSGLDAVFRWNRAPYKHWEQDKVEVYINGVLKRTTFTKANEFVYTLDMNRHDNGGAPSPHVEVRVYHVYTTGASSPPAIISVSHPLPPKPTIVLSSSNAQIRWQVTSPAPIGWESTSVQIGNYHAIVADMSGVVDATQAGVGDGQIAQVSIAVRNVFGQQSEPAINTITANYLDKSAFAANIRPVELVSALPQLPNPQYPQGSVVFLTTDNKLYRSTGTEWTAEVPTTDLVGTIDKTHFAANIRPVELVSALPQLPNPQYPQGSVVFLTTDNKLYRSTGDSWTAAVPTTDLSGTITEEQIADEAVTASKLKAGAVTKAAFATNIRPVELVSSLPQLPNPQYPQGAIVFLTTDNKLYRSTGTAWTAAVPTTDLSGTITETQIANDAVTTPKLKAGAVTTDKLAAGAVTADKLAANSVTAGKIAAGAVKADAIDAGAVTADKLAANSVTANAIAAGAVTTPKLSAGAVTTDKLAAGAVTADKLAANSVTAGAIAAGAVKADAIDSEAIESRHIKAGAVTTDKLAAGAVTADKLAANSVTAGAIAAGAVKADAIDAGTIGAEHIRAKSIAGEHIQAGAIRSEHIQSEAIDTRHLKAGIIESQHLKAGIIESQHIRVGDPLGIAARLGSTRPPGSLPEGGILFHFDHGLSSTRGLRPLPGYVATLRPGEGRFGGAVAVEEATENLLSESAFDRLAGVEVANINGRSWARRITRTSGTLYNTVNIPCDADTEYTMSIYARAVRISPGSEFRIYMGDDGDSPNESLYIQPGSEWQRYVLTRRTSPNATRITRASIHLERLAEGDIIEIADWQLEAKPYATSFVAGTRARGRLSYPKSLIAGLNALTVAAWTSGPPYWASGNKYLVAAQTSGTSPYGDLFALVQQGVNNRIRLWVRNDANSAGANVEYDNVWDGNWHLIVGVINKFPQPGRRPIELYVDGELVASSSNVNAVPDLSNIDEAWGVQVGHWRGSNLWNGLIDELLILPYAASPEEIRAWYELGAPFYDAAENVGIDTPEGHAIEIDRRGILITPAGFPQPGAHLDGRMLGFWDINNVPSIGIGDVRRMAAQLGSDMQYGILIAQGEIRASQSVLEASLTDLSVTRDKLGPGSVDRSKLSPGAVGEQQIQERSIGITRLGEQIQVPLISSSHLNVLRTESTSIVARQSWTADQWYTIESFSLAKRDLSKGLLMEAMRLVLHVKASPSYADEFGVRLRVAGSTVAHWDYKTFSNNEERILSVDIDARSLPDSFTVEWQWRRITNSNHPTGRWESHYRRIYQNDQLPLRWGTPQYSMDGRPPTGCFGGCQISCQSGCEASCQATCESTCEFGCEKSCQSTCESSCQSTCETTSQGGGGCIREGTPITIWDPDIQAYREVPVEQLQPGMILPGYNPETDTLEHGELIRLEDAKFSNRFLRIHTDNGPSVDVTYTQPFDVLADMGDGPRWYKLQAKFLKPGMKLVRPFEDPDKRLSTITKVEHVKEHMVHFWNPKTSHGRFIVAGYGDRDKLPMLPY